VGQLYFAVRSQLVPISGCILMSVGFFPSFDLKGNPEMQHMEPGNNLGALGMRPGNKERSTPTF